MEENRQVTGRRGRRSKQLLDGLKKITRYRKLTEEELYRIMGRTNFGTNYGPVVKQSACSRWPYNWLSAPEGPCLKLFESCPRLRTYQIPL